MKWRVIDKSRSIPPASGGYRSWKPILAQEGGMQCVYCCIHESQFGGMRNFHVEHFKPQSRFPDLVNDYLNLFYACGICNTYKSDDWPGELSRGDLENIGYPNPSLVDYSEFFSINEVTGEVSGEGAAGRYLVERMHLNRAHMVALRVISGLFSRLEDCHGRVKSLLQEDAIPESLKSDVIKVLVGIVEIQKAYMSVRPYSQDQLR